MPGGQEVCMCVCVEGMSVGCVCEGGMRWDGWLAGWLPRARVSSLLNPGPHSGDHLCDSWP